MNRPDELRPSFVFELGACFIAGTLVHTDKGLVPIEQLKVGDLVLSAPENGEGEPAYKRILKTLVRHDQPIMQVVYKIANEPNKWYSVTSTYDHPFWTEEEGWTGARMLGGSYIGPSRLRLIDGSGANLEDQTYIYSTDQPGIGWVAGNEEDNEGWLWDYPAGKLVQSGVYCDWEKWNLTGTNEGLLAPFNTTVYNIEVEDYHTYFVGEHGVWVHNANCDDLELYARPHAPCSVTVMA